jgi:hypothetical protein
MIKHALFVRLEDKPGKEKELADFFGLASSVLHAAVSRLNGKEKRRT